MKIWPALSILLGCGLTSFGLRTSAQDAAALPAAPLITDGAQAFKVSGCAQCHMIQGVGGHKGPDLSGVGRRSKKEVIEAQIVKGSDAMPEFGDVLPAVEIKALVEYLHKQKAKTPARPAGGPPSPGDLPKDDGPGV